MSLARTVDTVVRALLTVIGLVMKPILAVVFSVIYDWRSAKVPPVQEDLCLKSATELAKLIRTRKVKAVDVMEAFINRVGIVNPMVNAVTATRYEAAILEAEEVDTKLDSGHLDSQYSQENAPFLGVPTSVKEAFALKGLRHASGLVKRKNKIATFDAEVVARLKKAGAIPYILTNVSELCMWYESANYLNGRTCNAYDTSRIVGGSSGGEACIISTAGAVMGVGSDIGGSIRMPAFFNGVFGHKASRGLVPNEGQYPIATGGERALLSTGPLCRYAEDILPLLKVFAGPESSHKAKLDDQVDLSKLKIYSMLDDGGSLFVSPVDKQLKEAQCKVEKYLEEKLKLKVERVNIHRMRYGLEVWTAKMNSGGGKKFAEFMSDDNGRVNCVVELLKWLVGCSQHTLPAISLGIVESFSMPETDKKFLKVFDKLELDITKLLANDGILLYPSHPKLAPYHNEPILYPFNFAYTGVFNTLGLPVTQCPLGLSKDGHPLGLQVVTGMNNDRFTIALAREIEKGFGGWVKP
ncbi:Fatty-acid amide hydrolase 2 [Mizuhopecten yessoensis]|uniref:Fatty-acid amide hydrolase 2 n=3 Tax=Mizuhopecten yessoensis TaxID=6573 RepID=A0A210R2J0_MIZYE|nr:Fatty-acid amide hydrolase 2 [Mizuhopecten yessoensis]